MCAPYLEVEYVVALSTTPTIRRREKQTAKNTKKTKKHPSARRQKLILYLIRDPGGEVGERWRGRHADGHRRQQELAQLRLDYAEALRHAERYEGKLATLLSRVVRQKSIRRERMRVKYEHATPGTIGLREIQ